ncbi:Methyltransferase domain-containing protein [Chryseobacterium piscicola]|uniref:Methyltransferase n=1 Tax=Chryseobacterium piscicola TaxID=551459 RepID=A0A1N7KDJ1_9FLAO|nr:class I SAM-dependent methyltransferase [Chryseobacterium piscicola]PQA96642.1 methyltransferase [Chryseobacterium piscicola]SIS59658.1 Methyltransferase domain-containing protein [Chryseobacterium piscicola]
MSEITRILKTFIGYLKRPDLYPELGRKIIKNIFNRNSAFKGKEKTNLWASEIAISQKNALKKLFHIDFKEFSELYPKEFKKALDTQNACPIKMGGAGALELLYNACEFTQAKVVIETGVAYGWSSLATLTSLQKRNGTLYSSDMPYLGQNGDQYVGCVVPEDLRSYWKLFRHADRESLPKILKESGDIDVVHYDSDKSYEGMKWAYETLYPRLRKGGVFISDDINDNSAFQDFCEQEKIVPTVVEFEGKFVGVFVK